MVNIGAARAAQLAYMIGNSLTQDSQPVTGALAAYASDSLRYLFAGHQIWLGHSLIAIKNSPASGEFIQGGPWNEALAGRKRDFLTCQPYNDGASTMGDDVTAISAFIDAFTTSSPTGKCFLYQVWSPMGAGQNYQTNWAASVVDNLSTLTVHRRAYFNALFTRLAALYPGRLYLIPVGEVFFQLDIAIKASQLPGVTDINQIYRDDQHGGSIGRFATAATVLACLFRLKPQASSATIAIFAALSGVTTLTEAMVPVIETAVWNTVKADARTGV